MIKLASRGTSIIQYAAVLNGTDDTGASQAAPKTRTRNAIYKTEVKNTDLQLI
jgi:hypothetical protein